MSTFFSGQTDYITKLNELATANQLAGVGSSLANIDASVASAASSATNAALSYDQFDDRYLGSKAANPTLDNDGAALLTGAIYWNTSATPQEMRVWSGTAWVAVQSTLAATQAAQSATQAAGSATTASTQATNAAGSATTATTQATNAAGSATQAANSASSVTTQTALATTQANNAAQSASTATTQATQAASSATQANSSAVAANTSLQSTQAQANLAQSAAISASSVLQQDLSAISAALHRSPYPITAMFIYDTSKDSDGGAWTERMQDKSWANEPLNGSWRGQQVSEAAARAVTGATTGDCFQLITDGKHYRLNANTGVTEVFRGNKAKFPRLAAIVAEAGRVVIYDLTEAGRPMWMVFEGLVNNTVRGSVSTIAMLNGQLCVGSSAANGTSFIQFASDNSFLLGNSIQLLPEANIASRNNRPAYSTVGSRPGLVGSTANAIAMIVLADAPVDSITGLQIPTIAVANHIGVSVIRHDGTVLGVSSGGQSVSGIVFTRNRALSFSYVQYQGVFNYPFPWTSGTIIYETGGGAIRSSLPLASRRADQVLAAGSTAIVVKENPGNLASGVVAEIKNTHNTGHMLGDIRRAYLADVSAGSVVGSNLLANETFDSNVNGWSGLSGATLALDTGKLKITTNGSQYAHVLGDFISAGLLTIGEPYAIEFDFIPGTYTGLITLAGEFLDPPAPSNISGASSAQRLRAIVFPTNTGSNSGFSQRIRIRFESVHTAGEFFFVDNVTYRQLSPDRSYKNAAANITGTLIKTPVASTAQLVSYSGFTSSDTFIPQGSSSFVTSDGNILKAI